MRHSHQGATISSADRCHSGQASSYQIWSPPGKSLLPRFARVVASPSASGATGIAGPRNASDGPQQAGRELAERERGSRAPVKSEPSRAAQSLRLKREAGSSSLPVGRIVAVAVAAAIVGHAADLIEPASSQRWPGGRSRTSRAQCN